jgi:glycosyltransferase involved in cell wall biosynthesis
VHVHVLGPHERFAGSVAPERATFHGVLAPEQLRGLYWATDAFVAPVRPEGPDGAPGEVGLVDGFPTTAACEALAAGCALIHSNPRGDHRVLEPDVHYLEIPGRDPAALATAVRRLAADRALRDELALNGATRVREAMDVDAVVAAKLQTMGLGAA